MNAIELTQKLIRFDTTNPPGNEGICAAFLGRLLEGAGFTVRYDEFADQRINLVASMGGGGAQPPICFTGHMDTVPLGEEPWTRDAFGGEIFEGKLYGRGSTDMKSGLAAMIVAAAELAPFLDGGPGVVLVITAGEETGCLGSKHLESRGDLLGSAGAIVVGEPTSNYPVIGHKGSIKFHAHVKGVAAHGATPEKGVNAIYKAAEAVMRLKAFDFDVADHPVMGRPTLNVGTIKGGANVNSVPDRARIGIDVRTVPGLDQKSLMDRVARCLGEDFEIDTYQDEIAVWTEPESPWVQSVFDLLEPVLGERASPKSVNYFTDAGALRRGYGFPPTVILGPGEPELAHQTDEFCIVAKIETAEQIYLEIMRRWCRA